MGQFDSLRTFKLLCWQSTILRGLVNSDPTEDAELFGDVNFNINYFKKDAREIYNAVGNVNYNI